MVNRLSLLKQSRRIQMKSIEHLLKPLKIKSMEIPNRVVMPPMGTGLGNDDSTVSEANIAYMKRRARSGAGLIITEISEVHPLGSVTPRCLGVWDDRFVPGLSRLVEVVHAAGSRIAMQLHHCGRESYLLTKKKIAIGPSAVPSYVFGALGTPREMTIDEIHETIASFGAAARRAVAAGFDAVELHGAHGYLLMQFLSAHSNKRTDEYGGDFRARARFMIECLREVRSQVGKDFPISIRLSGEEGIKGGYSINDIQTIVPDLVKAGADIIHASFGTHANATVSIDTPNASAPVEYGQGFKVPLARKIKEVTDVPVIAVGRFTDPYFMDGVIARGDADLVAVGRQHLADPDFLNNARAGRPEDTCECLACNQGCIERETLERGSVRCAINPETGQELIYPQGPAASKRSVWVAGGGPAGLTAAYEAARLGHEVTLFERDKATGGQIQFAEKAPHKSVYGKWIRTLTHKCEKKGVEIKTGAELTEEMIDQGKPDVVILAIGADKAECNAEGAGTSVVCDAWQILNGEIKPGAHVLVVGGGLVGMETADFLCDKGVNDVTLVEMLARPPVPPLSAHAVMLYRRLAAAEAKLMFNTALERIDEGSVIVSTEGKERRLEPIDQAIIAVGVTPRNDLKAFLKRKGIRHFIVGDADTPRRIIEATETGAMAAWQI
jgi:2,4-dienoyl-CoA reductase-like NADH-dependent reductase (Old Yellow Enzyme family)/NADPH-dependent 2,4-dienoyl-CoA reductase/sulfur reductase-like enzyme